MQVTGRERGEVLLLGPARSPEGTDTLTDGSFTGGSGASPRAPLVEISDQDGVVVVGLIGEHDDTTVADLAGAVDGTAGPAARLVVDLSRTTWMDTSIVAWILGLEHRLEDGALALVVQQDSRPAKLLEILRLDQVLAVERDLDEAIASVATAGVV
jgi:anti-anti-sigma factor